MNDSDHLSGLGWLTCFKKRCHQISDFVSVFTLDPPGSAKQILNVSDFSSSNLSGWSSKPPVTSLRFWIYRHWYIWIILTNMRNTQATYVITGHVGDRNPWHSLDRRRIEDTRVGLVCPGWKKRRRRLLTPIPPEWCFLENILNQQILSGSSTWRRGHTEGILGLCPRKSYSLWGKLT